MTSLPTDAAERKAVPLASGVLDYFPDALAAVAAVSKAGNDQHNPGQPLHWDKSKSTDHADCLLRHLMERGTLDTDGQPHSAKVAWRALALLQTELDAEQQQQWFPMDTDIKVPAPEGKLPVFEPCVWEGDVYWYGAGDPMQYCSLHRAYHTISHATAKQRRLAERPSVYPEDWVK